MGRLVPRNVLRAAKITLRSAANAIAEISGTTAVILTSDSCIDTPKHALREPSLCYFTI